MSSKKPIAAETSFSEEEYGKRIDRCLTDTIVKGSGGVILGATLSLLLFRRRAWPILMGTGFGIGVAFKNCEKELNSINTPPKIIIPDLFDEVNKYIKNKYPNSDESIANNFEFCGNDILIKSFGGLIVGSAVSILFSLRYWPIVSGLGFGIGTAFYNCKSIIQRKE